MGIFIDPHKDFSKHALKNRITRVDDVHSEMLIRMQNGPAERAHSQPR